MTQSVVCEDGEGASSEILTIRGSCLSVSIRQDRKFLAEMLEFGDVDDACDGAFLVVWAGFYDVAIRINHQGASAVVTLGIASYTIDSTDVALVLDGTGYKQGTPRKDACGGPGSDKEGDVIRLIIVCIATPDGKSKVIADEEAESQAAPIHNNFLLSCGIESVFIGIGKEVVLVVETRLFLPRTNEKEAVPDAPILGTSRHTSSDGSVCGVGHLLHPTY